MVSSHVEQVEDVGVAAAVVDAEEGEGEGEDDDDDDNDCGDEVSDCVENMEYDDDNETYDYSCEHCSMVFKYRSWYNVHKVSHEVVGTLRCDYCPKLFKRPDTLKRHYLTHFNSSSNYDCDVCHKSFRRKQDLSFHITQHNPDFVKPMCEIWGKQYANKREPLYHNNRTHTFVRPYVCQTCNLGFHSPSELYRHKKKLFVIYKKLLY